MSASQRAIPTCGYSLYEFEVYGNATRTTNYTYDDDNRLTDAMVNGVSGVHKDYDTLARLTGETIKTGTSNYPVAYTYLGGANGSTSTRVGSVDNNGSVINYTYDDNGNIASYSTGGQTVGYSYDELNQLVRENNQILNKSTTYTYDAGGNILAKTEYPYTTGALGSATKTYTYQYGDTNWKDKLTSFDGKGITYDAIGNPLTYNGYTYTWQFGRQLSTISGNGLTTNYKYNDGGIRTQKTVNGVTTNYTLMGSDVVKETNGSDTIYYSYDSSGSIMGMNLNGDDYFYVKNVQGDIIGLIDKNAQSVVTYSYDSWGKLISIDGSLKDSVGVKNPYRYRSYKYDTETGLYYLQSRYYNPDWGRFVNLDDLGGEVGKLASHNLFVYCNNNAVNMMDKEGHDAIWLTNDLAALGEGHTWLLLQYGNSNNWYWFSFSPTHGWVLDSAHVDGVDKNNIKVNENTNAGELNKQFNLKDKKRKLPT